MGGQFSLIDVPKLLHPHLSAGSVSEQHAIQTWQIVRDEPIIPQNLPIDLLRISAPPLTQIQCLPCRHRVASQSHAYIEELFSGTI